MQIHSSGNTPSLSPGTASLSYDYQILNSFSRACSKENLPFIEKLFINHRDLITAFSPAFIASCKEKRLSVVKLLLSLDFDVHASTTQGQSNFSIWVNYLLEEDCDLDTFFEYLSIIMHKNGNIQLNLLQISNFLLDSFDQGDITFEKLKNFFTHPKFNNLCNFRNSFHGLTLLHSFALERSEKFLPVVSLIEKLFKTVPSLARWNTKEQRDNIHLLENQPLEEEASKIFKFDEELLNLSFPWYVNLKQIHEACKFSDIFFEKPFLPRHLSDLINKYAYSVFTITLEDQKLLSIKLKIPLSKFQKKYVLNDARFLSDYKAILENPTHFFKNKFEHFVKNDHLDMIKVFFNNVPKLRNKALLSIPVIHGKERIFTYIISQSAKVIKKDGQELIPVSQNINVDRKDKNGFTALSHVMNFLIENYAKKPEEKLVEIFNCLGLLLMCGADTSVKSKHNEEFFEFFIKFSQKLPLAKEYLKNWLNYDLIKISRESLKKALLAALQSYDDMQLKELLADCHHRMTPLNSFFEIPMKKWAPDAPLSTIAQFTKLQIEFEKERKSFLQKFQSQLKDAAALREPLKKTLILSTLLSKIIVNEEKRESERTSTLFLMLTESDLTGIKKEIDFVKEEILTLTFETDLHQKIMLELLCKFGLTIETPEPLTLKLSGLQNAKISKSQIDNIKRKYRSKLLQNLEVPSPIKESSVPVVKSKEIPLEPIAFEKLPKKSPRNPHPQVKKNAKKTEQVILNIKRKQESKSKVKAAPKKQAAPSKPKPAPQKRAAKTLPPQEKFELDEKTVREQLALKNREDYEIKEKKTHLEKELPVKLKPSSILSFEFRKNQKDRLKIAIEALSALKAKIEEFDIPAIILQGDRFLIGTIKKSLSYHLLRFLEALAPTSERLKNDEKDAKFFQNLETFFLSKTEIRALRQALRGSFLKIKISDLHNLINVFLENNVLEKLDVFSNKNKIFSDSKQLIDINLLKFNFSLEDHLKALDPQSKSEFLKKAIRKQVKFIAKCFAAKKEGDSTGLEAIKKSLSDISKLASFITGKANRALFNSVEMKLFRKVGNEIAHDIDLDLEVLENKVDLAEICKLFAEDNPSITLFLKKLY